MVYAKSNLGPAADGCRGFVRNTKSGNVTLRNVTACCYEGISKQKQEALPANSNFSTKPRKTTNAIETVGRVWCLKLKFRQLEKHGRKNPNETVTVKLSYS